MISKKVLSALAALAVLTLIASPVSLADEEEYDEDDVQVVTIRLVEKELPPPPPAPPVETKSFVHDAEEIETLARLLWSSPLRDEEAKKTLLWVVMNRVSDPTDTFGDSIKSVVTKHEFNFYDRHAHLSETNLRIAQEVMDEWLSDEYGYYIGRHVPKNGLYIRFVGENNRGIEVTAERGGEALAW
jgi:hypothetical protein